MGKQGIIPIMAALACLLAACDNSTDALAPVELTERETALYEYSCKTCHEEPVTGSPQSHDVAAWTPRLKKGDATLLDNIVNGFNGMPPLGQCIECTADDFIRLTRFMAAPATEQNMQDEEGTE